MFFLFKVSFLMNLKIGNPSVRTKQDLNQLQTFFNKACIPFFPLNFRAMARHSPFFRTITGP